MQCLKAKHRSRNGAVKAMKALEGVEGHEYLRPYLCTKCNYWHLTSETQAEYRKEKRKHKH